MSLFNGAKSREELASAPDIVKDYMRDYIFHYNARGELFGDICERFAYPSLWAAIERLVEHTEKLERAIAALRESGYGLDDALAYVYKYNKEP